MIKPTLSLLIWAGVLGWGTIALPQNLGPGVTASPLGTADEPQASPSPEPASDEEGDGEEAKDKKEESEDGLKPFEEAIKKLTSSPGLFTLYQNLEKNEVFLEIRPDQLNHHYLFSSAINAGVGEFGLYRGFPLQDFAFTLRRHQNTLQVVMPNSLFRDSRPAARSTVPQESLFSDSVVFTLPIVSIRGENQSFLVDLSPLLLDASTGLGSFSVISMLGYGADPSQSTIKSATAFPENLEFDLNYRFTGGSNVDPFFTLSTLPNASSFNLGVRYGLSQLPVLDTYRPRIADERVGYFVSAFQDLAQGLGRDRFVRYINRWHLEKADPSAPLSPPKEPIVFWIDAAVPEEYRTAVTEGVLMWNQAFEPLGYRDVLEVKQMPEDAPWDVADSRYNTIRWTDSVDGGFALAIPRTNPLTGQILGASILIDANMVRYGGEEYEDLVANPLGNLATWGRLAGNPALCDPALALLPLRNPTLRQALLSPSALGNPTLAPASLRQGWQQLGALAPPQGDDRCYGLGMRQHLTLGMLALTLGDGVLPSSSTMQDYLHQFLRSIVAHEVGHTLGLRHNFHGSTLHTPEQLQDAERTKTLGLAGSLMDYLPVNLAPLGGVQGEYFPSRIGPYDQWAIAYGYTPLDHLTPQGERNTLQALARQAPDPHLDYGTDEDAWSGLDPAITLFDLTSDPLTYNQNQMDLAQNLWIKLDKRFPSQGRSYTEARPVFNNLLNYYFSNAAPLTAYVGGRSLNRYQGGDAPGRKPFEPVPAATQRQALEILGDRVFNANAFQFPPELASKLGVSRWFHDGSSPPVQDLEYPLADVILINQTVLLGDLLYSDRLERLRDAELLYPGQESLSLEELLNTLEDDIWLTWLRGDSANDIPLIQRRLQTQYVTTLLSIVDPLLLSNSTSWPDALSWIFTFDPPPEAQSLARHHLQQLAQTLDRQLGQGDLSLTTRSHLETTRDRILQTLD
jgi:hypothetical protein